MGSVQPNMDSETETSGAMTCAEKEKGIQQLNPEVGQGCRGGAVSVLGCKEQRTVHSQRNPCFQAAIQFIATAMKAWVNMPSRSDLMWQQSSWHEKLHTNIPTGCGGDGNHHR